MTDTSLHSLLAFLAFLAVLLGGLGAILGGISVVLHAIAQRTKNTVPATLAADVDAARADLNKLTDLVHGMTPSVSADVTATAPQTPSAKSAQAGRARMSVIAALAVGAATLGAIVLAGCATLRSSAAAGISAFIDCEDPALAKTAADLEPLAKAVVSKWIGGASVVLDTQGLKSDIAGIKAPAQQCAITAAADAIAMAAISTSTPTDPAAPLQPHALVTAHAASSSAASSSAGDQVRAAFTGVRSELGWAPIHLANGRVL